MRLHELAPAQIEEWRQARMDAGRAQYGDAHMRRYGLVDVMEELLDAINIIDLAAERMAAEPECASSVRSLRLSVQLLIAAVRDTDKVLPDRLCSEAQGVERVWWSEQVRYKVCDECGETPAWCGCEEAGDDGD